MSSHNAKRSPSTRSTSHTETSGMKTARNFLAFALFLAITALSLTACARLVFFSSDRVVGIFNNEKYVTGLYQDVADYITDQNKNTLLPEDTAMSVVTYERVYQISNAYAAGAFSKSADYTETTYETMIEELQKEIKNEAASVVKENRLETDKNQKDGTAVYAEHIAKYIKERVELPHKEKIMTLYSVGKTASLAAIFALALIVLILALIVSSVGTKTYRSLRSIVHALTAASVVDLMMVGGAEAVKHFKTLWIFPLYLRESAMNYVNSCIFGVFLTSNLLFVLALAVMTVIWRLNRNSKK